MFPPGWLPEEETRVNPGLLGELFKSGAKYVYSAGRVASHALSGQIQKVRRPGGSDEAGIRTTTAPEQPSG